jgi:hypothetical protein
VIAERSPAATSPPGTTDEQRTSSVGGRTWGLASFCALVGVYSLVVGFAVSAATRTIGSVVDDAAVRTGFQVGIGVVAVLAGAIGGLVLLVRAGVIRFVDAR